MDVALILAIAASLLGGLARGFTGFGAALVIIPVLIAVYGPIDAVILMTLMEVPATLYLLPVALREADWRAIAPLGLASLCTIPLGAWLLASADADLMRRGIGVLVVVLGLALASGWRYRAAPGLALKAGIGGVSGFLGGAANLSGPPVVLFLLAGETTAASVRAGIIAFFSMATLYRIPVYWHFDLYAMSSLSLSLVLAPAYLAGIWCGSHLFRGTSELLFRRIAFTLVIVAGIIAIIR